MRRQRLEWLENVVCAIDLGGEYEEYYDDEGGECGDGDDFGGGDWHVPSARWRRQPQVQRPPNPLR